MNSIQPRICMVSLGLPPLYSGIGRQALALACGLAARGYQVKVLTTGPHYLARSDLRNGVEIIRLGSYQLGRPKVHLVAFGLMLLVWLWRFKRQYDLVHVHGLNIALAFSIPLIKKLKKPVVLKMTRAGDDDPISVRSRKLRHLEIWI